MPTSFLASFLLPFCRRGQNLLRFSANSSSVRRYGDCNKMPSALVLLAEGAEEMETVISVDVLRRGGFDVTVAGLTGKGPVKCSRDVTICPDAAFSETSGNTYDIILLPGGNGGSQALAAGYMEIDKEGFGVKFLTLSRHMSSTKMSAEVGALLKKQEESGRYIAAVCAAPIALNSHGIAKGKKVTSHPAVKDTMVAGGYTYSEDRVVVDDKLITSRGPGTCFEFALAIVSQIQGKENSDKLVAPMLVKL